MPYKDREKRLLACKRLRKKRFEKGLCFRCGVQITKENYGKRYHCKPCHDKLLKQNKRRKDEALAKGICIHCLKNPISGNSRIYCPPCIKRATDRATLSKDLKCGYYVDKEIKNLVAPNIKPHQK